jgi:hypothetical protein
LRKLIPFIHIIFQFSFLHTDFISLIQADKCETIIEMYVEEGQIRITIEIGLNDMVYFPELVPVEMLPPELQNINRDEMLRNLFRQALK